MKNTYLIGALASLLMAPSANAQSEKNIIPDPLQPFWFPTERPASNVEYSSPGNREIIYCDDFSNPDDWVIETDGQGAWEWATETPEIISQFMGEMASETADNGFALFNGMQWLFEPPVMAQESTFTFGSGIDCSSVEDVIVTFHQMYRAYHSDQTFFEVSIDAGQNWQPFQVNADILTNQPVTQGNIAVNITDLAAGEADVRFRFRWKSDYQDFYPEATQEDINNFGSGYFWILDDICFMTPPENEIAIGDTWYQNFFEIQEQDTYADVDLINAAEYHTVPFHSLRPFNFACVVTNNGMFDQTNVQMVVTVTNPDESEVEVSSPAGFTLPASTIDTLKAYDEALASIWNADATPGTFTIEFKVVQDQEDEMPNNNIGTTRYTRITDDNYTGPINGGGAVESHSNASIVAPNTADWNLEENVIHGNRYTFDEFTTDRWIAGIQFALQEETLPGQQILLNIRKGSVLEEESADNEMDLYFSYENEDLPYITDEADFTNGSTPLWITYELPYGILIEPNTIYQAEIMLPVADDMYCRIGATLGRTNTIGVFYYFPEPADEAQGWYAWSTLEYNLRLVTTGITSGSIGTDDITVENGIKLTQNYPNPFTDQTRIQYQFDETTAATLEVYDMSGKLVFGDDLGIVAALTANSYMFNKGSLSPGVYTYSIVTENNRITRKMTIQ